MTALPRRLSRFRATRGVAHRLRTQDALDTLSRTPHAACATRGHGVRSALRQLQHVRHSGSIGQGMCCACLSLSPGLGVVFCVVPPFDVKRRIQGALDELCDLILQTKSGKVRTLHKKVKSSLVLFRTVRESRNCEFLAPHFISPSSPRQERSACRPDIHSPTEPPGHPACATAAGNAQSCPLSGRLRHFLFA